MRLKIFTISLILLSICGYLHAQSVNEYEVISNLSIYSGLIDKGLDALENQLVLLGKEKIYSVKIASKRDINEYFYLKIKQRYTNYKIISGLDSASSDFTILFDNVKFVTGYKEIFGSIIKSRRVKRKIVVSYNCIIAKNGTDSTLYNKNNNDLNEDEFLLERIEDVERGEYDFLKGKLPEQSFWEKAFIPGIVILASAAAIILFFEIRSK